MAGARRLLRAAACVCLALLAPTRLDAAALPGGMPLIARYTAEDYPAGPVNLAVLGDPRGVVWSGNGDGLLRFAGGRWELIELPGRSPARALAIGPDGELYVGGYDRIGRIEQRPTGETRFVDLQPRFGLEPKDAALGNVWDVLATPDGVWFRAERRMLRLGTDGRTESWPLPATLRGVHAIGREIYGRLEGQGLARFADGAFTPLPGGERFAARPFNAAFAAPGDALLVLSADGFFRADARGIVPVPTPHDALLKERDPYTAVRLPDGGYAIGTTSGHVLHFDAELALRGDYAIDPYAVIAMGLDREGGVWVATEGGLVRLAMPSPWTVFGASDGLRGQFVDSAWIDGTLYVGGSRGLYRAASGEGPARFQRLPKPNAEVWDLEPTPDGLFVGTRNGAYRLAGTELEPLAEGFDAFWVRRSQFRRGEVYALGESQLVVLAADARGAWSERLRHDLGIASASSIVERADGELWLGDSRGGPIRLVLAPGGVAVTDERRYGAADGLAIDPDAGTLVFELDGRLHVASGRRFARYDGARFADSDAHGLAGVIERPMSLIVRPAPGGTYALSWRQLLRRARGAQAWEPIFLDTPQARGFVDLAVEPSGVLRLITWNGVLQFDPDVAALPQPELEASLRRVERHGPDGAVALLPTAAAEPAEVPSRHALRFTFELLSSDPGREFRYRVAGLDDEWRPWAPDAELALASIGAGDYALELEARTRSGRHARPLRYPFRVAPAWYEQRSTQLMLALAALLALLVAGRAYAVRRSARIEQRNRRLEQLIGERTRELERANAQLARLATLDGLTAVPNRRGFDAFLDQHWTLCRDERSPLSLLMIDVDHFKQFNDRHGHLAGDEALRAVALELARFASGEREILARFGGEEFAMVLSGATTEAAVERANYVREHFAERAERDGLTLSIGVASCVPELGIPPRQLIDFADAALYQAKRNGRNRVEVQRAAA